MIPRSNEVTAVVALLEDDSFPTSEALAKALVKLVAGLLAERDAYGVGIGLPTDDVVLPYGPFYGKAQAQRVADAARDRGLRSFVSPLFASVKASPDPLEDQSPCSTCGHVKEVHASFGCAIPTSKPKERSNRPKQTKCPCSGYTRKAAA